MGIQIIDANYISILSNYLSQRLPQCLVFQGISKGQENTIWIILVYKYTYSFFWPNFFIIVLETRENSRPTLFIHTTILKVKMKNGFQANYPKFPINSTVKSTNLKLSFIMSLNLKVWPKAIWIKLKKQYQYLLQLIEPPILRIPNILFVYF